MSSKKQARTQPKRDSSDSSPELSSEERTAPPATSPPPTATAEPTVTVEALDRLIRREQATQHPYGKVWQRLDYDAFSELIGDIHRRGQDQVITVYQGMILEGWHRYIACLYLNTLPKLTEFDGTDLEAAELVHASGIRRQSTAEQRYASFLMLGEACAAFRQKYEQLRQRGIHQQQAGTPLSTDGQRVDVVKAKAAAAGVSRATAAKVEKVKKENPEAVADIAAGKTSANKVLKKGKTEKGLIKAGDGDAGNENDAAAITDKKFDKLMSRAQPGGDMHDDGGTPKATQTEFYKLTVVTPAKADLDKFGEVLPSSIIDFNAHSVTGRISLPDIIEALAKVGTTLSTTQPKKVRIVVEL